MSEEKRYPLWPKVPGAPYYVMRQTPDGWSWVWVEDSEPDDSSDVVFETRSEALMAAAEDADGAIGGVDGRRLGARLRAAARYWAVAR